MIFKDTKGSFIADGVEIEGNVKADGDIEIKGMMKGYVFSTKKVSILGRFEGKIESEIVEVKGFFSGEIFSKKVFAFSPAEIRGRIYCSSIFVEEGVKIFADVKVGDFAVEGEEDRRWEQI